VKVGNVVRWSPSYVRWSPTNSHAMIGIVLSYCSFQDLWRVMFPTGRYEIEEHYLEIISESR